MGLGHAKHSMSEFLKAVEKSRVPPGKMLTVEVGDESVLIANIGDQFCAMGAICNHEQWDLSEGTLSGFKVTCAGHGSIWDLRTGKAEFDEPLEDEPLYDVKEEGGFIYVKKR
ncbi:MAG TPA: Rieske 2Fe-2S domain-containing protein [Nitrososphaerales archaeon]|nr:Rieske 2Fe-2S domain-containing protein [Nitrososphaerales archaeon]